MHMRCSHTYAYVMPIDARLQARQFRSDYEYVYAYPKKKQHLTVFLPD